MGIVEHVSDFLGGHLVRGDSVKVPHLGVRWGESGLCRRRAAIWQGIANRVCGRGKVRGRGLGAGRVGARRGGGSRGGWRGGKKGVGEEGGDGGLGWWRWRVGDEGGVGGVVDEAVADEVGDDEGVSFRDGVGEALDDDLFEVGGVGGKGGGAWGG